MTPELLERVRRALGLQPSCMFTVPETGIYYVQITSVRSGHQMVLSINGQEQTMYFQPQASNFVFQQEFRQGDVLRVDLGCELIAKWIGRNS